MKGTTIYLSEHLKNRIEALKDKVPEYKLLKVTPIAHALIEEGLQRLENAEKKK